MGYGLAMSNKALDIPPIPHPEIAPQVAPPTLIPKRKKKLPLNRLVNWLFFFLLRHMNKQVLKPDGYSKEEVSAMFLAVRRAEERMHWQCPDPKWEKKRG
jgi:hypothetical protein